ncbi:MAG: LEA type 2 family protein [Halobacteriaceae archaeon]
MDIRSALLGSKLRIAGTVLLVLAVGVAAAYFGGVIGVPQVESMENSFGTVNESTTVIETNVTVNNPNPIGISLGGVSLNYTVDMNEVRMASGDKTGISIGTGNSTVTLTTLMDNSQIPKWWVSHIRNGEQTTVDVRATVTSSLLGQSYTTSLPGRTINTDLLSSFNSTETRAVNANHPIVSDPVAYINETSASWGQVTQSETPTKMAFVVYNPKSYPITVSELGYNVTMAGVDMGDGATQDPVVIQPHSAETIRANVVIDNTNLDRWWVEHLQNGQSSTLRITFYARASVGGQTIRLPLDAFTHEEQIETDIFGGSGA